MIRRGGAASLFLGLLALTGCGSGVDTTYGTFYGKSVNGTAALAELLRARGHEVRVAGRLDERLSDRADVIVRFAPYPGPIERRESEWYMEWLRGAWGRRLVYVPRDYDAAGDYWRAVLEQMPADADAQRRAKIQAQFDRAKLWVGDLPSAPKEVAKADEWFEMQPKTAAAQVCNTLSGPWAKDVDATAARITRHETPKVTVENPLLEGDGAALVMEWHLQDDSAVLVVANGSFLLNAALLDKARRGLGLRVVDWIGGPPRRVVFVEGSKLMESRQQSSDPPIWTPLLWVLGHLLTFGLLASLARAVRLGRPRPEPASGADRPSAHAEALGDLLARTGDTAAARALLDTYQRWRQPSAHHSSNRRASRP